MHKSTQEYSTIAVCLNKSTLNELPSNYNYCYHFSCLAVHFLIVYPIIVNTEYTYAPFTTWEHKCTFQALKKYKWLS